MFSKVNGNYVKTTKQNQTFVKINLEVLKPLKNMKKELLREKLKRV